MTWSAPIALSLNWVSTCSINEMRARFSPAVLKTDETAAPVGRGAHSGGGGVEGVSFAKIAKVMRRCDKGEDVSTAGLAEW